MSIQIWHAIEILLTSLVLWQFRLLFHDFEARLSYCKSGNIRGTLIFAYFTQIQQARIQKPAKIFAIFCMHILDT